MKAALIAVLALGAACLPYGPTTEKFAPAQTPHGIESDVLLKGSDRVRIRGELLEVRQAAILVLRDGTRVTLVPFVAIRTATFGDLGATIGGGQVSRSDREQLRLVSRFPSGLRPELEAQLLAAYGQTEFERVSSP